MSNKKERMLNHIQNNTGWFMTASDYKVIPYTELSMNLFNTAKSNFAWDADYENVVCLISTSIWEDGKCGVLFTTKNVYTKSWGGPFTSSYKNPLSKGYSAEFSNNVNEFNTSRMKEMLWDLYTIAQEEDEKDRKREEAAKRLETLGEVGQIVGGLLLFGMATTEVVAFVSEMLVDSNNEEILDEIQDILADLE